jgi:4-diphosphocytidyl-2-C-methyl-D-erythritol kinase
MIPVPWCDILEIVPAQDIETTLAISGIQIDSPPENNLCYKGWRLMADKYRIPPVSIHLHKVIPAGAGLGGGSSDASFTLKMLNSMFNLNLDNETLRSLAVQLGMDCSFFIENVPALSTGRGEFLKPVPLNLDGYCLVIVKPPVHISTAAAFLGTKPFYRENLIEEIVNLPVQDWKRELRNDFENTVFDLYPEIQDIRNLMYRHRAIYSSMSGSGSAVYGLFTEKPAEMDFPGCDVFQTLLGRHP